MISAKRIMFYLSILACVCIIGLVSVKRYPNIAVSARLHSRPVIIVDAGHGGFDGGAVASDGTVEKNINLKIALVLGDLLKQSGFDVIMTRTNDNGTDDVENGAISARKKSDLKNRLELMEDYPDSVFVSIHLNKFTTSAARGAQVFYSPKFEDAMELGKKIQKSIIEMLQPENTRVIKKGTSSTYLLHNALVPAVIVECGFLSNKEDLTNLKNTEYQQKMAFAIFCGIMDYYSE